MPNPAGATASLTANVSSSFGWADATDLDLGDSHRTRAFRFTLTGQGYVRIGVTATNSSVFYPAYSLYSGLAQVPPENPGHDGSAVSQAWLATLPGSQEGVFNALGDWAIGNDPLLDAQSNVLIPASLRHLAYIAHFADGSASNYGPASGLNGDGLADGYVEGGLLLGPADYTIVVGGGDYAAQLTQTGPTYPSFPVRVDLFVIPEPGTGALALAGMFITLLRRRKMGILES
ncbi:MAG: hypothetical protein ACKO2G_01920 [Verrucomicrobiales bacterium]